MRVGFIAPNYYPIQGGNAVTVRRIVRELEKLGCEVQVFPIDQLTSEELVEGLKRFRPQLLHAFHAHRGGKVAHALAAELDVPYIVTVTGSDIYQALIDQRGHDTREALRGAARVVAFHGCMKRRLGDHLPTVEERTVVIPQGVDLPAEAREEGQRHGEVVLLLPAGIRRVKNVLFPVKLLAELREREPGIRLLLVGPVLEADYAVEVLETLEGYPFAKYLGGVRHEEMAALYGGADIVLNCSLFEGGMANSVLEAMAHGKPLLASDIEGNRSVVKDEATGLLYNDAAEFIEKAHRLASDAKLREKLGKNGRAQVASNCSPEREGKAYLELYREALEAVQGSTFKVQDFKIPL